MTVYTIDGILSRTHELNGCVVWTGPKRKNGYSRLGGGTAHRVIYELHKGKIAKGLHVDHLCRNKLCIKIEHLEAVTPRENVLRGEGIAAKNARKTHCLHGHELAGKNLYITPKGRRECKRCRADATFRYSLGI